MAHPIALQYIRKTRLDGFSDAQIHQELEKAGWPAVEIENAFSELARPKPTILDVKKELASPPPELELPPPKISTDAPPQLMSRENIIEDAIVKTGPVSTPAIPQKRKSFAFISAIVFVIIAASAGAGGFVYWRTKIVPERAVARAIENFKTMRSWRYEAEFIITEKSPGKNLTQRAAPFLPPFANILLHAYSTQEVDTGVTSDNAEAFKIRAKGASNLRDAQNPAYELILTLGTRTIPGINENIEMALKLVSGTYYFQFTRLPPFDSATSLGYGVPRFTEQALVGKWASLDPSALASDYNSYLTQLSSIDPAYAGYRLNTDKSTDLITKNEQEQIQKLWEDSSFISWDKDIFSENLSGVPAYRIKGIINRTELGRFFESVAATTRGAGTDVGARELAEFLKTFGDAELNLWIAKNDEHILKTTVHTTVETPGIVAPGLIELFLAVDFSDIDKDITINAPENAHDLRSTLARVFADSVDDIASMSAESRDARRVRDLSFIQSQLEIYRKRNEKYPKTLTELVPEYTAQMPSDPKSKKPYSYVLKTKTGYMLSAELENRQHPILSRDANPMNATYDVIPGDL